MSAGRGTPRVGPIASLAPIADAPSQIATAVAESANVADGDWQWALVLEEADQVLASTYSQYLGGGGAGTSYELPAGAVRMALSGIYTPAAVGGTLGLTVRWRVDLAIRNYLSGLNRAAATVVPAVFGGQPVIEIPAYPEAFLTPPTLDDSTPYRFILPFWVPPQRAYLPVVDREENQLPLNLNFDIMAREAGGVSAGSLQITQIVAESFGTVRPLY